MWLGIHSTDSTINCEAERLDEIRYLHAHTLCKSIENVLDFNKFNDVYCKTRVEGIEDYEGTRESPREQPVIMSSTFYWKPRK
jgi:hypothetical protein